MSPPDKVGNRVTFVLPRRLQIKNCALVRGELRISASRRSINPLVAAWSGLNLPDLPEGERIIVRPLSGAESGACGSRPYRPGCGLDHYRGKVAWDSVARKKVGYTLHHLWLREDAMVARGDAEIVEQSFQVLSPGEAAPTSAQLVSAR